MKKFFILIIYFLFMALAVWADIVPTNTLSINKYGIGTLNLPNSFSIHECPRESSRVLKTVNYEGLVNNKMLNQPIGVENTLIAYIPSKNVALVAVETDNEDGWYEIYYDQKNGKTGWVYDNSQYAFRSWQETFSYWGKQNGLYFFRDVPVKYKKIHSQDSDDSQILDILTKPRLIRFSMIRGNWMVAQVQDIDMKMKIGWLNWRLDDGRLIMFPYFQKPQIQY